MTNLLLGFGIGTLLSVITFGFNKVFYNFSILTEGGKDIA